MRPTVCILAAGRGTRMGSYSSYINKALLPINKKAVISHIIDGFGEPGEVVIALGHLGDQVRNYLEIAHPSINLKFVTVPNFDGPGSGPGLSLLACKEHLQKPFYFVSCDTLWDGSLNLDSSVNWLGVASVPDEDTINYCNVEIADGKILGLKDKQAVKGDRFKAFVGLCHIKDFNVFWEALECPGLIAGEHQVSKGLDGLIARTTVLSKPIQWNDVGNLQNYRDLFARYEEFDFCKSDEFFYTAGNKVIKFFHDASISQKRAARAELNAKVFPRIQDHRPQFFSYQFINGNTLYSNNNLNIFTKLLDWLDKNLWEPKTCDHEEMKAVCKDFYYNKTLKRIEAYHQKYPQSDVASEINGLNVPSTSSLLKNIPWDLIYKVAPAFIHGDLQFDNIIRSDAGEFVLLDWRQDFSGKLEWGDLYYDLAKLNGGIILNYDLIKKNIFSYSENNEKIYFDFAQRFSSETYLPVLNDFILKKGLDLKKVRLLVPMIFLNMSPLHHYPFDKMLYSLGRSVLFKELQTAAD